MITVRELVELTQNRLAGGDVTADIQAKYPKQIIKKIYSLVFADLGSLKRSEISNMGVSYDCTLMTANGQKYIILPSSPLNGLQSIIVIKGMDGESYPVMQGLEQMSIMEKTMPSVSTYAYIIQKQRLYLKGNPTTSISISYLPDFSSLSDDDYVCAEGSMSDMMSLVMQKMRENGMQVQEVYNNGVADTDKPTNPAK